MRHRDPGKFAPERGMRIEEGAFSFVAHCMSYQPSPRKQRLPARIEQIRRREAAAREDRIGWTVEIRERFGRLALDDAKAGGSEAFGVALDETDTARAPLDGDCAGAARGPHPLDADRAATGPDVPEELAGTRGEGGEGGRPAPPAW